MIITGICYPGYCSYIEVNRSLGISLDEEATCDPLRVNPAHPTKTDFQLEAIIITKVTF